MEVRLSCGLYRRSGHKTVRAGRTYLNGLRDATVRAWELVGMEEAGEGSSALTDKLGFRGSLSLKSEAVLGLDPSWLVTAERRGLSRSGYYLLFSLKHTQGFKLSKC